MPKAHDILPNKSSPGDSRAIIRHTSSSSDPPKAYGRPIDPPALCCAPCPSPTPLLVRSRAATRRESTPREQSRIPTTDGRLYASLKPAGARRGSHYVPVARNERPRPGFARSHPLTLHLRHLLPTLCDGRHEERLWKIAVAGPR